MNTENLEKKDPHSNDSKGKFSAHTVTRQISNYNGWLISDNFFKRALAIFGHYVAGALMVGIVFWAVVGILAVLSRAFIDF